MQAHSQSPLWSNKACCFPAKNALYERRKCWSTDQCACVEDLTVKDKGNEWERKALLPYKAVPHDRWPCRSELSVWVDGCSVGDMRTHIGNSKPNTRGLKEDSWERQSGHTCVCVFDVLLQCGGVGDREVIEWRGCEWIISMKYVIQVFFSCLLISARNSTVLYQQQKMNLTILGLCYQVSFINVKIEITAIKMCKESK